MRENCTHGSEGGDGESRSRPLSLGFRVACAFGPFNFSGESSIELTLHCVQGESSLKLSERPTTQLSALMYFPISFSVSGV